MKLGSNNLPLLFSQPKTENTKTTAPAADNGQTNTAASLSSVPVSSSQSPTIVSAADIIAQNVKAGILGGVVESAATIIADQAKPPVDYYYPVPEPGDKYTSPVPESDWKPVKNDVTVIKNGKFVTEDHGHFEYKDPKTGYTHRYYNYDEGKRTITITHPNGEGMYVTTDDAGTVIGSGPYNAEKP